MTKDSIVRQGEVNHVKHYLPLRTTPSGVDPLERTSNLELFIYYLELADDLGGNQIQRGPASPTSW